MHEAEQEIQVGLFRVPIPNFDRQAGFDPIQQEQMVMSFIDTHGSIKRADVVELCHISPDQAYKLLARLKKRGEIEQIGERKGAIYKRAR